MNERAPDKTGISLWLQRGVKRKLDKLAVLRQESVTDVVTWLITKAVANVELTPDDYREIAEETERARQRLGERGGNRHRVPRHRNKGEAGQGS